MMMSTLALLASPLVLADDNGQESGQQISGVIDATQKAVKELQAELEKRPQETKFNAADYKDWNRKFRTILDDATVEYVSRLDKEVTPGVAAIGVQLKPLNDRLYSVEHEPTIRDDQRKILVVPVQQELYAASQKAWADAGPGLYAKYREIYLGFLARVFPSLPHIEVIQDNPVSPFRILALAGFVTAPLAGDTISHARMKYQVSRFDNVGGTLKQGQFIVPGKEQGQEIYNVLDWKLPKVNGVPYFEATFIDPTVKEDCQTQVCLGLKAADLALALGRIAEKLDIPFQSPDGSINAPGVYVKGTVEALQVPVVDHSLPFDTNN